MAKAAKKKAARKRTPKPAGDGGIAEKRAKAYADMESYVSDLVNMGTIAIDQFDKNEGLFVFAVSKLEDMLNEFKAHYYAEEFPTVAFGIYSEAALMGRAVPHAGPDPATLAIVHGLKRG